jgi:hypothetical protein
MEYVGGTFVVESVFPCLTKDRSFEQFS